MKILLIGLGGFGKHHLRVWRELGHEVFVSDIDAAKFAMCGTYNIPADHQHPVWNTFLDRVDAVDVVTQTDAHFDLARACLQAGKDVFVEKPLALSSEQALALLRLNETAQRIVQVGHIFRFNPAAQYIKMAIANGQLGQIRCLQGFFKGFKRMRTDVGVTQTDSIHFFDLFNWFLGQRPIAVTAITRDYAGRGLDDLSHTLLEYDQRIVAHVESGYFDPRTYRHVTIVGEEGAMRSDIVAQRVELFNNRHVAQQGHVTAVSGGVELPAITTKEPLELELRAFLESVRTRRAPLAGIAEGYVTLKVTEAAYASSSRGARVLVQYEDANEFQTAPHR